MLVSYQLASEEEGEKTADTVMYLFIYCIIIVCARCQEKRQELRLLYTDISFSTELKVK